MGEAIIRDAREEELADAGRVMLAAYEQYRPGPDEPENVRTAWERYFAEIEDVGSRWEKSSLIVAEVDGRIAGTVTFYPPGVAEEYPGGGEASPREWAGFRLLAVDPDVRGLGIGRMLSEECIRRAREAGAPVIGLHTTELMKVARAMYERMGFERAPEYDFYPIPDDPFCVFGYKLSL